VEKGSKTLERGRPGAKRHHSKHGRWRQEGKGRG
jgi:hypothetical protein